MVGNSAGLPPLWTRIAALIGAKMFGILGIIFFIPLMSVLYTLLRENTNRRLAIKEAQYAAEAPAKSGTEEIDPIEGPAGLG